MINRLTKWSVATYQRLQVAVGSGAAEPVSRGGEMHACNLELDINTDAKLAGELAGVSDLFDELVATGLEIAIKGDVP
jgi:hypothetical protein